MKSFFDSTGKYRAPASAAAAAAAAPAPAPVCETRRSPNPSRLPVSLPAGGLWQSGGLVGKTAGVFVSIGTQGGGMEVRRAPGTWARAQPPAARWPRARRPQPARSLPRASPRLSPLRPRAQTTALTAVTQFAHHGMVFVPTGYTFGAGLFDTNEVGAALAGVGSVLCS